MNGRRAWRKWLRAQETDAAGWRYVKARSLVGMTQGARKRAIFAAMRSDRAPDFVDDPDWFEALWNGFRLGERLRPCPGCRVCGHHRYQLKGGFRDDATDHLHWDGLRMWLVRKDGDRWPGRRRRANHKRVPALCYPLALCEEYVSNGTWERIRDQMICDGSGAVPARKAKR